MSAVLVLLLGTGLAAPAEDPLVAAPIPTTNAQSLVSKQAGSMNTQMLEIGAGREFDGALNGVSAKALAQEQSGFGNDQRMAVGRARE